MQSSMVVVHDDVSTRLDELADLCEHWEALARGEATPQAVHFSSTGDAGHGEAAVLDDMERQAWSAHIDGVVSTKARK